MHASRLRDASGRGPVVITVVPARPEERSSLLLAAHGLTAAQRRVASLVLQGRTTGQIVVELHISAHTVQNHLETVFDVGVCIRRQLAAALMLARAAARLVTDGCGGWVGCGSMIEVEQVSKRYGTTLAVDDLSFVVPAGRVTGFLGPNGAGKSTTMRMIVGLDKPSAGRVLVHGAAYRDLRFPLHQVGALLEARAIHAGRSARNHLRWLADSNGIPAVGGRRGARAGRPERRRPPAFGGFSLGMGQQLGIAAALLATPGSCCSTSR